MTMVDVATSTGRASPSAANLLVERVENCLVVRSDTRSAADLPWGPMAPVESGKLPVLVAPEAIGAFTQLPPQLLDALSLQLPLDPSGRRGRLRLLVSNAAHPSAGTASLAARLSWHLDVDVIAPSGPLLIARQGQMFCTGPNGGWRTFIEGRDAGWHGPRVPAPRWQDALPSDVRTLAGARPVTLTPVPAGLWVRHGHAPNAPASDPAFGVPAAPDHLGVLVGRPGEPQPRVDDVCGVVNALPPSLREQMILMPYGPRQDFPPLAQQIADHSTHSVLAAHVLPLEVPPGRIEFAARDSAGHCTWRMFVSISEYRRHHAPVPWSWRAPFPEMGAGRDGVFDLADGWVLELLPCGILVRPRLTEADAVVLSRPVDPHSIDIVLAPGPTWSGPIPDPVLRMLHALLYRLPKAERQWLNVFAADTRYEVQVDGFARYLGLRSKSATTLAAHVAASPAVTPDAAPAANPPAPATTAVSSAGVSSSPRGNLATGRQEAVDAQPATKVAETAHVHPAGAAAQSVAGPPEADAGNDADETYPSQQRPEVVFSADGRIQLRALPRGPRAAISRGRSTGEGQAHHPESSFTGAEDIELYDAPGINPATLGPALSALSVPSVPGLDPPGTPGLAAVSEISVDTACLPDPAAPVPGAGPVPGAAAGAGCDTSAADRLKTTSCPGASDQPSADATADPALAVPAVAEPEVADNDRPEEPPSGDLVGAVAPAEDVQASIDLRLTTEDHRPILIPNQVTEAAEASRWIGHQSTVDERQALRGSLGWRYDAASSYVKRLLSERPGLRGLAGDDGAATDLAAVHLFAESDPRELIEALRNGTVAESQRSLLSCLVSGLQRLPSFIGVVRCGAPLEADLAALYAVGADVLEPAPLMAVADPEAHVPGSELLIWSSTARRLDGLVDDKGRAHVIFLPGTVFRVLAVDSAIPSAPVLLAETLPASVGQPDEKRQGRILSRLQAAARPGAAPDTEPDDAAPTADRKWTRRAPAFAPGLIPRILGAA